MSNRPRQGANALVNIPRMPVGSPRSGHSRAWLPSGSGALELGGRSQALRVATALRPPPGGRLSAKGRLHW